MKVLTKKLQEVLPSQNSICLFHLYISLFCSSSHAYRQKKIQCSFYYDSIYLESVKQKPKVALCIQTDINQGITIIYNR